jgi:hypothetical protein
MVELVDTHDLKSCDLKSRAGSIPALSTVKTKKSRSLMIGFFVGYNVVPTLCNVYLQIKLC